MTSKKAFQQLISLYDVCDNLESYGEDKQAKQMRNTLNKLSTFIVELNKKEEEEFILNEYFLENVMFEKIKKKMIKNWLKYETTDIHPMLNDARNLAELYEYFIHVLSGGGFEDFLENYGLSIIINKQKNK